MRIAPQLTAAFVAGLLLVGVAGVAPAAAAVPLYDAPGRLYTAVDLPIAFDGTPDPISDDTRSISISGITTPGCTPTDGNDYSLTGCASIKLEVFNGSLSVTVDELFPAIDTYEGIVSGGAILQSTLNGDGSGPIVQFNGTMQQINDGLETLVYTPDPGYEYNYNGDGPENITMTAFDGGGSSDNYMQYIDIRVRSINDFPTLTAAPATTPILVAAGGQTLSPDPAPGINDPGDWTLEDPDVDDPITTDLGLGHEMLLVSFTTCGAFSLRGGLTGADELSALIDSFLTGIGITDSTERTLARNAILDGMPSEVTSLTLSSNDPTAALTSFAAIGTRAEIVYALSQVTYRAAGLTDATCELISIVSDLGHNGMPAKYIGSPLSSGIVDPEQPVPGFEVPFPGFDFDSVTFQIGDGVEVSLPTALNVTEGASVDIPVSVSVADHPELAVALTLTDVSTDASDYANLVTPVAVPEGAAGPVNSSIDAATDVDNEPSETFTVSIDPTSLPEGVTVAPGEGTVTITILDDTEDPPLPAPTVTVEQGGAQVDPTSDFPIFFDVEFSQAVTGLTASDFSFAGSTAGGTLAATLSGGPTTYTVGVTGMTTGGLVQLSLPAGSVVNSESTVNTASSSSDNQVTWAPPPPLPAPTVTVEQGSAQVDPTSDFPIFFDVEFSQAVIGLTGSDFSFAGSTAGGALLATISGGPTTYTVGVTGMTTGGIVRLSLPAGSVVNSESTLNTASTSSDNQVTWAPPPPLPAPTVTVEQGSAQVDPTSDFPIFFDVEFSQAVTGLTSDDFSFTGSTAGGTLMATLSGGPTTYTVGVTGMTTGGLVKLSLPAGAVVNSESTTNAESTSSDNEVTWAPPPALPAPTVTVDEGSTQDDPTAVSPILFDVVFSQPVTGLTPSDFSFAGSTVGGTLAVTLSGGPTVWVASVAGMTTGGDVVLSLPAGVAQNSELTGNAASSTSDNIVAWAPPPPLPAPTVTVDQGSTQPDPTAVSPILFDVVFSQPVSGLTSGDFSFTGSTVGGALAVTLSGGPTSWVASVAGMTTGGDVVLSLPAGVAQNSELTGNAASSSSDNIVAWDPAFVDVTKPTATVNQAAGQPDPTGTSPISFTVVFSEPITGFSASDLSFAGSTAGGTLAATISGAGITRTVTVAGMTTPGIVKLSLPADTVADLAGNLNVASSSTDNEVTWDNSVPDTVHPGVLVAKSPGQPDPTTGATIAFTVTFTEPVAGFDATDLDLSTSTTGSISGTVSGAGAIYVVTVTGMDTAGNVILRVDAGAAVDGAGNDNDAATYGDNIVAWSAPVVVTPPTGPTGGSIPNTGLDPTNALHLALLLLIAGLVALLVTRRRTLGQ